MITPHDRQTTRNRRRGALLAVPVAAAGLVALGACGSSGSSSSSAPAPSVSASASAAAAKVGLKTAKVSGTTLLTSAKGFTVYSFAPDTATKSVCNGACAASWPPVKSSGTVKGPYATIKRSNGSTQLTFHGRPLYTFTGDTKPGQANGNGVNAFGGLWHDAPATGARAPAGNTSPGSGGGY
jgi:predicted lipoprotein with Yx(FWY)xxD motif